MASNGGLASVTPKETAVAKTTFPQLMLEHATARPQAAALREKEYGIWQTTSWGALAALVRQLACGLAQAGLKPGEHVVIIGENRPRLQASMLAVQSLGAVAVPLYQDAAAAEFVFPIVNAEVAFAVVEDQEQVDKLLEIRPQCPQLVRIWFDDPRGLRHYSEAGLDALDALLASGAAWDRAHPGFFDAAVRRVAPDDEAAATLLANLDGKPLADPRPIRFATGMRKKAWVKNVVALGLASGFLEPLESTSIHMVQSGLQQLLDFFPDRGFAQVDIDAYNDLTRFHYERIRDFIILHYHANQRTDSDFWQACANMAIPATLREKLDLYKSHGRIQRFNGELFTEVGWLQVLAGQNIHPDSYHPLVDVQSEEGIHDYMEGVADVIRQCIDFMPGHDRFIADYCKALKV
jgi:hypothetical protein